MLPVKRGGAARGRKKPCQSITISRGVSSTTKNNNRFLIRKQTLFQKKPDRRQIPEKL